MNTLDNLRKSAKRWLKAVRANDPEARNRLARLYPEASETPTLRDIQHALALEHGHASWIELKKAVNAEADDHPVLPDGRTHVERVALFLDMACWDHHVHGKGDHRMYDQAALRLLENHPEIARDSLYTAVVCGDLEEVDRLLAERPEAANEPGGARGWPPLLYLCYARFSHQPTITNAVAIAKALLDKGADPNAYYMAGDSRYTALVGAAGEGEQDSPRQPQAESLYRLLLERGAGPYDIQVLYNTHFSGDVLWWLELTYAATLKQSRKTDWDDPNWPMLDMGGYGRGAYFLLRVAITKNDLPLAKWLLERGASPNARSSHPKFKNKFTLYEEAVLLEATEIAELLLRYGAKRSTPELNEEQKFIDACFRLDRAEAQALLAKHPEYHQSTLAMFAAAQRDRTDVVELLLDLGVPIEVASKTNQRTLHQAAGDNALSVVRLLIDRGAEVDPIETQWGAPPIGWAAHGDRIETLAFLSRFSRSIWTLAFRGFVDRVREVLDENPALARLADSNGITPLWWLPDDESKALKIVDLLIAHGADPKLKSKEGRTAADWAMTRGMVKVVERLGVENLTRRVIAPTPDLERYEQLAQNLFFAYQSGIPSSIRMLEEHYGRQFTWDELRTSIRQRLKEIPESEKPEGYFALPHARFLIAREAGFTNWAALQASL
jgi:uncharacterized protein